MKNNKGFSLVELLVALAVSGIIMTALLVLITQSVNAYTRQSVVSQLQNECDLTLNQVAVSVMESDGIYLQCGVKYTDDYSNMTTLGQYAVYTKLSMSTDENGALNLSNISGYKLEGNTLYYVDPSGQKSEVCDYVESFVCKVDRDSFTYSETNTSEIDKVDDHVRLILSITMKKHNITRTVTRTVQTRNSVKSKLLVDVHSVSEEVKKDENNMNTTEKVAISAPTVITSGKYINTISEYIN